ncbi:hypothetical protein [Chitinophaga pinensis]|uniref:Lipoprotein n=1 Tax=Chitinophaga pinensis TaxID=79329 RepID=A0A5C6LX18_9BACT|nr:hypothetical protein [Chitinophaga pinensis]TWW01334.1 hypothetical protein FEF09_07720 [Chitinophaga pinensis]
MKYILLTFTMMLFSCRSNDAKEDQPEVRAKTMLNDRQKQLNLSILLDLSDRIDPKANPDMPAHFQKDSALISYLTEYFKSEIRSKGGHAAKPKMRIIFSPNPADPGISKAAEKLSTDLSGLMPVEKKKIYDNIGNTVTENISYIYRTSLRQAYWPGSDIWRFFKNDVDITIDPDTSYRNILVIFTDGYLFHADSKDAAGNRYAYLLPGLLDKYKLRNNPQWSKDIDKLDFGLISKRADLDRLEVLVVEVTPATKHKNDEDIIRKVLDKWFAEMKIKKWKILNTDLPQITKGRVESFLRD